MTATQYIAIYAAIIATFSLTWNIIQYILNNRRKIKVDTYILIAGINKFIIKITIINIGKEPISLMRRPIPKFKNLKTKNKLIFHDFLSLIPKDEYPIKLNKEECKQIDFDISEIFKEVENAECKFIVEDVRGIKYKSNILKFSTEKPELIIE